VLSAGVAVLSAGAAAPSVLFAVPLATEACGYAAETPLAVLPPHAPAFFESTVLAAADGDDLWIAVNGVEGAGTIDVYSASSCSD
jgi:hypothetical protein